MEILTIYVKDQKQTNFFKDLFQEIGQEPIIRIAEENRMLLPAIRTTYNLYEGLKNVSLVIRELKMERCWSGRTGRF